MTTINKPMTGEQLDELMTIAVNMQRDSEKIGERSVAMFAYAVQVAVLEIHDVRSQLAESQSKLEKMAAENAALKSGVTYFACGSEYGFDLFNDKQAAINTAQEEIDLHREAYLDGSDGWDEDVRRAAWGIVIQSAQGYDAQGKHTSDSQHTYQTCDYRLEDEIKTPATDAFLAEVRAQGVEMLTADRKSEWLDSYIEDASEFAAQLRQGGAV